MGRSYFAADRIVKWRRTPARASRGSVVGAVDSESGPTYVALIIHGDVR